ncbi:hypothetical protein H2201_003786 [Coniosporium apollinis]|uniref:Uncharacterized protein n=1 Tax=Coniosporium apollinis TaxID=61459 RepID=A0ABQ9NWH7_9PEZI|nr:hypothetical protein H2201_003786 [Coniosporium apollinis]
MHGDKEDWIRQMFCTLGVMREYLLADERVELKSYAKGRKWKEPGMKLVKENGATAPLNWYNATEDNHRFEAAKDFAKGSVPYQRADAVPWEYRGCRVLDVCHQIPAGEGSFARSGGEVD